ncbi:VWA domain-containing protein [Acetobacter farinalis]|uniref:VWA domain-containing protein n=1 Tax=Acetobacter farinalis TaxID=1260984 RepID=A0ABT3Q4B9_9PROT|nr:VWA domain-containing protein [Acetobacter farinalis]MCX2560130.1 VWA domain-containing protein [Acetobacter farinalis]NHO28785.1 VWA domain-containing protein [Acetobacter farinalis]
MPHALSRSLGFAPLVPLWVLAALGLLALALCGYALFRRSKGAVFRLAAMLSLLLWLAGPQRLHESWHVLPETALLLVDQSPSMSVGQRAAIARQAASTLAQAHTEGLNLRTVPVRSSGHNGTRLFDALDQAAADIPPDQLAGAVMITDGQVTDIPPGMPDRLRPTTPDGQHLTLPLHILLPARAEETDRQLRILQAPPYAIVGQPASLRVQVDDLGPGTTPGMQADVTLRVNGEEPVVIPVRTGSPQDISLPVPRPGQMLVSLSVSPLEGEVSQINNQSVTRITGIRDRLRVLLISGTPNQGERVWRRLLKADPSVDLIHFTILRPPDKDDGTPLSDLALIAFPVRELFQDKINQFDLIILDGFENRNILPHAYLNNIANFVRKGGGLLLTGGPEFVGPGTLQDTPVGDILPAHVPSEGGMVEQRFRPKLTAEGRRHPVTAALPGAPPPNSVGADTALSIPGQWGPWYRALKPDSTHGQTLMSGPDNAPLLVLDHVDQGRVALLLSDQIWLWSRGEGGGGPQAELLRRISHWLMKEPELEEEQLTAGIAGGELTVTRRSSTGDPHRSVTVTSPSGATTSLRLQPPAEDTGNREDASGLSLGRMPAEQPGIWQVDDGTHKAFAAPVQADPQEFADLRTTATRLNALTTASGGGVFWLGADSEHPTVPALRLTDDSTPHGAGWMGFPHRNAHVVTGRSATPLLPAWVMLVASLGLFFAGWWREGRR